jgi:hypothetical protein
VSGHAFPISVTLDRMYTSRGNIQRAESAAEILMAQFDFLHHIRA